MTVVRVQEIQVLLVGQLNVICTAGERCIVIRVFERFIKLLL